MSNSKNILYLISLMLLMLTGCEADTSWAPLPEEGEEPVEVRLYATTVGAGVEVSRASGDTIPLPENMWKIGMTGGTYQNIALNYDETTQALKRTDQGTIYYPLQTDTMHIYAYAPFKEEAYISDEDSVKVKSDWETSQEFDGYITDPIWAHTSVTKNNPTGTLTFKHAMSRLQICLMDTINVSYTEHRITLYFDCPQYGKMSMTTGMIKGYKLMEDKFYAYTDSLNEVHSLQSIANQHYEHTIMPESELKRISVSFKKENNSIDYQYNYPEEGFRTGETWIKFEPGKTYKINIDFGKIKAPQVNVSLEDYEFENEEEIYI